MLSGARSHGSITWQDSDPINITDSPDRALVVAPTHLKFVQSNAEQPQDTVGYLDHSPGIKRVWESMEREMREAKALVFIGYFIPRCRPLLFIHSAVRVGRS